MTEGERGRVAREVVQTAAERGACVDVVVHLADAPSLAGAAGVVEELARGGVPADVVSVRCNAPVDEADARRQGAVLARVSRAMGGVPLLRRGPVTRPLLAVLGGSPVVVCEDGGAVAARVLALLQGAAQPSAPDPWSRENQLERAAAALSDAEKARLESRAYVDVLELVEALGARDSAPSLSRALERRLAERG